MTAFARLAELRPYLITRGLQARALTGAELTFAVVDLEPRSALPEHSHANEQAGMVLRGAMEMTIAGETRLLTPGEAYLIPANTPHSASAGPEGATVVDVFSPPRADWEQLERLEPAPPAWP